MGYEAAWRMTKKTKTYCTCDIMRSDRWNEGLRAAANDFHYRLSY